jgi:hypothetical protein
MTRMPLRVAPESYAEWLDSNVPGAAALISVRKVVSPSLSRYETDPALLTV